MQAALRVLAMLNAERRKYLTRGLGLGVLILAGVTGLLTVIGMVTFMIMRRRMSDPECAAAMAEHGYDIFNLADAGGYFVSVMLEVPVVSPLARLLFVLPIVAVTCLLFSQELANGSLATLLLRPVRRWEVITSKGLVAAMYTLVVVALPVLTAMLIAAPLFGFDSGDIPVECTVEYLSATEAAPIGDSLKHHLASISVLWFGLMPVVSLAALFSVVFRSPIMGIIVTMLAYLLDLVVSVVTGLVGMAANVQVMGQAQGGGDPGAVGPVAKIAHTINQFTLHYNQTALQNWVNDLGQDHWRAFAVMIGITVLAIAATTVIWQRRDIT